MAKKNQNKKKTNNSANTSTNNSANNSPNNSANNSAPASPIDLINDEFPDDPTIIIRPQFQNDDPQKTDMETDPTSDIELHNITGHCYDLGLSIAKDPSLSGEAHNAFNSLLADAPLQMNAAMQEAFNFGLNSSVQNSSQTAVNNFATIGVSDQPVDPSFTEEPLNEEMDLPTVTTALQIFNQQNDNMIIANTASNSYESPLPRPDFNNLNEWTTGDSTTNCATFDDSISEPNFILNSNQLGISEPAVQNNFSGKFPRSPSYRSPQTNDNGSVPPIGNTPPQVNNSASQNATPTPPQVGNIASQDPQVASNAPQIINSTPQNGNNAHQSDTIILQVNDNTPQIRSNAVPQTGRNSQKNPAPNTRIPLNTVYNQPKKITTIKEEKKDAQIDSSALHQLVDHQLNQIAYLDVPFYGPPMIRDTMVITSANLQQVKTYYSTLKLQNIKFFCKSLFSHIHFIFEDKVNHNNFINLPIHAHHGVFYGPIVIHYDQKFLSFQLYHPQKKNLQQVKQIFGNLASHILSVDPKEKHTLVNFALKNHAVEIAKLYPEFRLDKNFELGYKLKSSGIRSTLSHASIRNEILLHLGPNCSAVRIDPGHPASQKLPFAIVSFNPYRYQFVKECLKKIIHLPDCSIELQLFPAANEAVKQQDKFVLEAKTLISDVAEIIRSSKKKNK